MPSFSLRCQRAQPASGVVKSAVLLLHGLGADGNDLIDLGREWQSLLPDTLFLSPDAPQPCDMAPYGRQWFSLQEFTLPSIERGLRDSACPALAQFVEEVRQAYALDSSAVALAGFSQGCMTALYSVYRLGLACAGVVGYSGLLAGDAAITPSAKYPPCLLAHGNDDMVVPAQGSVMAAAALQQADVAVDARFYPFLAHGINAEGLEAGGKFLQRVLVSA